jgi:hypothetical protein
VTRVFFTLANLHYQVSALREVQRGTRILALNEASNLRNGIKADPKWQSRWADTNALCWRTGTAIELRTWRREILREGGSGDRRWEDSWAVAVLLKFPDGSRALFVVTHFPSKAWTVWPWRREPWKRARANTLDFIADIQRNHYSTHKVPVILCGDFNRGFELWRFKGFRREAAPVTFGKRGRYDQIHTQGKADIQDVSTIETTSDHRAVRGLLTLL